MHVLEMDVTDDASVERGVAGAVAKAGRVDVAINNAGYYLSGWRKRLLLNRRGGDGY